MAGGGIWNLDFDFAPACRHRRGLRMGSARSGRVFSYVSLLVVRCLARAAPVMLIKCQEETLPCLIQTGESFS